MCVAHTQEPKAGDVGLAIYKKVHLCSAHVLPFHAIEGKYLKCILHHDNFDFNFSNFFFLNIDRSRDLNLEPLITHYYRFTREQYQKQDNFSCRRKYNKNFSVDINVIRK